MTRINPERTRVRPYFTLVFNEGTHLAAPWGICFGDYNRAVVRTEMEDEMERLEAPRTAFKIIRTETDNQAEIDAAVEALNDKAPTPDYNL